MTLDLDDRVYLVLGSSRGIGLGIAQALLGEGGRVVLTGRDPATLEATARALLDEHPDRVISCAGDLGQPATLATVEDATHQRWGRLDGIVANIGGVRPVPEWKIDEADWDWFFEANLWASVRAVTHFIPHLISSRGAIVFIGSIAGVEEIGAPLPYASAKAALTMCAKGLARRLAPSGIRVNTIAPGNVLFPGGNWDRRRQADPEGVQRMIEEKVPLGMFGKPEDVGSVAAFLLSPRARFVTGSCVVVDGGQLSSVF